RRLFTRWCAAGRGSFSNPVLQSGPRIEPSKDVGLHVPPQALERGVVRPVLPQLGYGRGRVIRRHSTRDQRCPRRERLEVGSILDADPKNGELRRLRAGFHDGRGGGQLFVVDVTELDARNAERDQLSSHGVGDLSAVRLLGDSLVRLQSEYL